MHCVVIWQTGNYQTLRRIQLLAHQKASECAARVIVNVQLAHFTKTLKDRSIVPTLGSLQICDLEIGEYIYVVRKCTKQALKKKVKISRAAVRGTVQQATC